MIMQSLMALGASAPQAGAGLCTYLFPYTIKDEISTRKTKKAAEITLPPDLI